MKSEPRLAADAVQETSPSSAREQARLRTRSLFEQYHQTGDIGVRDELIRLNLGIVGYISARFAGRGESREDVYQVGCLGLMKAVMRFEPERNVEFLTYAVPTVTGEIKRYLRDHGRAIRMPRSLQALWSECDRAIDVLTCRTGSSPTVGTLAAFVGVSEEQILEAREARESSTLLSIEALEEHPRSLKGLASVDPNIRAVESQLLTESLLQSLSEDERRLIELRFIRQMSQRAIARHLCVSQMQVSRLLAKAFTRLKKQL